MRPYASRVMVLPEAVVGSSVTTNVLPALREVTRVWTLTLSNSVIRQFGICSVNARSSSALGLSWIFLASTGTSTAPRKVARLRFYPGLGQANRARYRDDSTS